MFWTTTSMREMQCDIVRIKLVRLVASVTVLALMMTAALPAVAYAGNITNTSFSLNVSAASPVGSTDHTTMRDKLDNMPSYAIAYGYSSGVIVGISGISSSLVVSNRTKNLYAYFRSTYQHSSIRNFVYENGEPYAWLWMYKTSSAPTTGPTYVYGEWSPDASAIFTVNNNGY